MQQPKKKKMNCDPFPKPPLNPIQIKVGLRMISVIREQPRDTPTFFYFTSWAKNCAATWEVKLKKKARQKNVALRKPSPGRAKSPSSRPFKYRNVTFLQWGMERHTSPLQELEVSVSLELPAGTVLDGVVQLLGIQRKRYVFLIESSGKPLDMERSLLENAVDSSIEVVPIEYADTVLTRVRYPQPNTRTVTHCQPQPYPR